MVAVKSLWVLLKSFSTNFSFKRDSGVKVPDHKPDKRIRYNRLRPQWHRPYYPSSPDPEVGSGGMSSSASGSCGFVTSSKSYQDYLNGNCGDGGSGDNKFGEYQNNKDFENFINSDSDYEDGDSDADFDDDFTTTDEDEDSDLDDEDDVGEEVLTCEVCERVFPSTKKLADHQIKKRHFGCLQCDSIFSTEKALDFHREQMDHFDFVSDYGTDDASSSSASVVGADQHNQHHNHNHHLSCSSGTGVGSNDVEKCSPSNERGGNINANVTGGRTSTCCSGRRNIINNNYCYANQLQASWYEGDDEEEKGLLRN
ncbi:unnamed protein product [Orchesella dallaii]|uniref:C2H2-type domain-containing protein n=1 Tax=Orchesella dallaii TaxID=48710 RepID=A0ABP1QM63_9HEXA